MRPRSIVTAGILAGVMAAAPAAARSDTGYVVALEPGTSERAADRVASRVGVEPDDHYHGAIAGLSARMSSAQVRRLRGQPEVLFVQRDVRVRAASTSTVSGSGTSGELVPPGVRRIGAGRGAAGVGVAVLDTGIASSSELNLAQGANCVSPSSAPADDNGHGTHVAGIIGARANGVGTVGAAPGTALHPVKVLNARSTGTLSQLLCGLDWVLANASARRIGVVNISIAAKGADDGACGRLSGDALHRAMCALTASGVVVVAAAGNAATGLEQTVPAAYVETLAATAMTDTDGLAGGTGPAACSRAEADDRHASISNFSTRSTTQPGTLAAPGVCVTSTGLKSATAVYTGTSQAAPHAAAAAALCLSAAGAAGPCAGLTPSGVIARLRTDARSGATGFAGDPLRPVSGRYYGPLISAAAY